MPDQVKARRRVQSQDPPPPASDASQSPRLESSDEPLSPLRMARRLPMREPIAIVRSVTHNEDLEASARKRHQRSRQGSHVPTQINVVG